jgi:hypothetical protein
MNRVEVDFLSKDKLYSSVFQPHNDKHLKMGIYLKIKQLGVFKCLVVFAWMLGVNKLCTIKENHENYHNIIHYSSFVFLFVFC